MATNKDVKNLEKQSPLLFKAIEDFVISKPWIAKRVYSTEWNDDEANQKKLTIRLRNKLNGNGNISLNEIKHIEDALLNHADGLKGMVERSKSERSKRLKKTIKDLLEYMDEEDKNDLIE